jgi:hypothetical protein
VFGGDIGGRKTQGLGDSSLSERGRVEEEDERFVQDYSGTIGL